MLGAALRRCAVAATTRADPRGLLHSARTPGPAVGKAPACHCPRPRVLAVTWVPAATPGRALPGLALALPWLLNPVTAGRPARRLE